MELTPTTTHVTADDGTRLAVHLTGGPGAGDPLLCLPGGPMLDSGYFRDLGGLGTHRALALLDLRGTGASDAPADPASYRCDRQVADVEAVRRHLGLERLSVLGHSAGANLAYGYAAAHPDRVGRLVLVAPSVRGLGIEIPDAARSEIARLRAGEPWYADAAAALARVQAGRGGEADWRAISPFMYARWDDETRAYEASMDEGRDDAKAIAFAAEDAFDPASTRTVLASLDAPVLVLAGGCDSGNPPTAMAEVAAVFPHGDLVVQEGAGHFPWVDDPGRFVELLAPFVRQAVRPE
jgi:pimeloyl-ACP methyl ester carboxylesterase